METSTDPLWPALVASVLAVAIGGVSVHFKLFIESDRDFRNRVSLRRRELIERLATRFVATLQQVRRVVDTPDMMLRGDGRNDPDLIGDFAQEAFKFSTVIYRLEIIRTLVRSAYFALYVTIGLGIAGVLLSWLWTDARPYLLWIAIGLVVSQIGVVYGVMRASASLEVYEDVG